jgi:hypothetical protein
MAQYALGMHLQVAGHAAQPSRQSRNRNGAIQGTGLQRINIRSCAYNYDYSSLCGGADWRRQKHIGVHSRRNWVGKANPRVEQHRER